MTRSPRATTFLAGIALAALAAIALTLGEVPLSPRELLGALASLFEPGETADQATQIVWQIRAPRIAAALLVGAALAAAGTAYQGMFRNALVSPDILGVSAGAAAGAVLAIFFSQDALTIQIAAFIGGLAAVALAYAVASAARRHDPGLALVLSGVVIGSLLGAVVALVKTLADPLNQLPPITFWLLGSLASVAPLDLALALPLVAVGLIPLWLLRWRMNLLALDDDEARSLGVPVTAMRLAVVSAATLMTAACVAISGVIGWVGLLIPHAARLVAGPEFSRLLPLAMLFGAAFLLVVDTVCRTATSIELPPGVVTALVGTPAFLVLLLRARRGWT
ncbi:MAG: iron ABC transporter permease [Betaproteobacteria bacterium RIFCSPLOWO2_02_FULL_66_14]|nr:MAG: iron ABC transporter permease [Betaproteobacteria bacterium RIFCSPLOWO2_02_FULL_66_14]